MKKWIVLLVLVLMVVLIAKLAPQLSHGSGHHGSLIKEIQKNDEVPTYHLEYNSRLDTSLLVRVHPKLAGVHPFYTETREDGLNSFPCSNCHSESLAELQAKPDKPKNSHWNLSLQHASSETMECLTCHSESNLDELVTLTGKPLSINRSFELCGQCHSTQYKDWQGGAHGKQLNGWAPPRLAKTCVGCHNPHNPSFPTRLPARYSTQKLEDK
ncbi:hypothetical protein KFE98_07225 [bacterium SCSIO 12741]|nr:hypothetical protein KFE98_07225 [bacterium SCSIO 12741]